MKAERTSAGEPCTYLIEVGPIIHYGFGKSGIARMERETRRALDLAVRAHLLVGPRAKVVTTTVRKNV